MEDIGMNNCFLNRSPIVQEIKERIEKWDCINLKKHLCTSKKTIIRVRRQPTEWEKIFASYSKDRGLIHRIHKKFKKLNKGSNNPVNKWANKLNRQFSKKYKWLINTGRNVQHP
jgi:hypothetical protein